VTSFLKALSLILFIIILIIAALFGLDFINKDSEKLVFLKNLPPSYEISTSHTGPLIKTTRVIATFDGDVATAKLTATQAPLIKKYQNVILFDINENLLPLGGKVDNIPKNDENNEPAVEIKIPTGTVTDLLSSNVDIIYLETSATLRLPITALQEDNDGNQYIWFVLTPDNEETKLQKIYLDDPVIAPPLFSPNDTKILSYHYFVLDPDENLSEETPIKIEKVKMRGPIQNPIEERKAEFQDLLRLKDYEDMRIAIENCGKSKPPAIISQGGTSSLEQSSCGLDVSNMPEEFQLFFSLINQNQNTGN